MYRGKTEPVCPINPNYDSYFYYAVKENGYYPNLRGDWSEPVLPHRDCQLGQSEAVAKSVDRLENDYYVINDGPTGSGKGFVAMMVAQSLGYNVHVIAPAAVTATWEDNISNFSSSTAMKVSSYDDEQGRIFIQSGSKKKVKYDLTDNMKEAIKKGCVIVVDEFQRSKNYDGYSKMLRVVCDYVRKSKKSKVFFCSFVPFDAPKQLMIFSWIVGYTDSPLIDDESDLDEIELLLDAARNVSKRQVNKALEKYKNTKKKGRKEGNKMYTLIVDLWAILWNVTTFGISGFEPKFNVDYYDIYYEIEDDDPKKKEIFEVIRAINGGKQIEHVNHNTLLKRYQSLMLDYAVDLCIQWLEDGDRVTLGLNYNSIEDRGVDAILKDVIAKVNKHFSKQKGYKYKYSYANNVISGPTSSKKREDIASSYRTGETNFVVMNIAAGATGLSLQYTGEKNVETKALFIPCNRFIDIIQFGGRFVRLNMAGDVKIYCLWAFIPLAEIPLTKNIMENNTRKKWIALKFVTKDRGPIKMPGEYQTVNKDLDLVRVEDEDVD